MEVVVKIEREVLGEIGVLTIKGKMFIGDGDEMLRSEIGRFLDEGVTRVLLDFKEVPYIDSAAMSEIVRSYTSLSREDGIVALLHLCQRLDDFFRITKLDKVFPIFTSKEVAIQALKDGTWDD